ncbi:FG-GAP and VCBS repeat-containing protein [Pedobacter africanus]|uniref:Repeat domain-containing protein n=1 Tax=Pedobacter africanus TaxID=151894 RepID=A0A1W2D9N0_9SPHI|nr:VCBS repeat-containing protein [Pedobacter africanus]SMC94083.1 Repeat domain-containing protein [Pedobacter africanus]
MISGCMSAIGVMKSAAQASNSVVKLAPGFKIEANGKPIAADIGHAAPFMIDFDGDGRKDLVMGEFKEGKARVYLNVGTDKAPQFKDFSYLQAGGKDASVPPACCIGFDPSFMDLNGDGIMDVTSGQYTGGYINFYEGIAAKPFQFKAGVSLLQPELEKGAVKDSHDWSMRTANFIDFDDDGDYDMVWGNVSGAVFYAQNTGTKKAYKFAESISLTTNGSPAKVDSKSDPFPVDWDGDGIIDLLVGSEASDIVFFKGKKKGSTNFEPGVSIWTGRKSTAGAAGSYQEVSKSMEALGEKRPYPGYRVRLGVTDWNGDGKLDLMVGNCYSPESNDSHATSGNVYVFLRQ